MEITVFKSTTKAKCRQIEQHLCSFDEWKKIFRLDESSLKSIIIVHPCFNYCLIVLNTDNYSRVCVNYFHVNIHYTV